MTLSTPIAADEAEVQTPTVRTCCLGGALVAALAVVSLAGAASQPIPSKVVRDLRVQQHITLHSANRSQAKVSLSQAVRSLGNRLQGRHPLGGWLVRFTDHDYVGVDGVLFHRRLAWLVVAKRIMFPSERGSYRSTGCWFVGANSGRFLEGSNC